MASCGSIERQETAGFVRKEQSLPAHLLIVRCGRLEAVIYRKETVGRS
jgi:hypothetical protein